jgi:acetyl esterase/lipase
MKQILFLFLFPMVFIACQKETGTITDNPNAEKTILNVSYGSDTAQRMDVYLPANRNTTATKLLVMIHGGAWTTGDKVDFNEYLPVFKQRLPGYALFNINYRLASLPVANLFPTQENDVKAAFSSVLSKAAEYGFNKDKLVVLGASAGGHLALLQAYKNTAVKVNAVVDMFGPTDMVALYNSFTDPLEKAVTQALLSGTPASNAALYQSSSPINFVTAQSPPTLILHGGLDPLVPLSQSTALKAKLETAGVPVQMVVYPSEGHSWTGPNLTDTYDKIAAFLTQYNP